MFCCIYYFEIAFQKQGSKNVLQTQKMLIILMIIHTSFAISFRLL